MKKQECEVTHNTILGDEPSIEPIGVWHSDRNIDLIELNGAVFALYGWNGEKYTDCWKCSGEYNMTASKESYTLTPVYRYQAAQVDISLIDEDSDTWEKAVEVVDYEISRN